MNSKITCTKVRASSQFFDINALSFMVGKTFLSNNSGAFNKLINKEATLNSEKVFDRARKLGLLRDKTGLTSRVANHKDFFNK